ncbi:MAG: hypothetical protein SPI37_08130, partial [Eubacteriales bacterium]|nr:hypothetical protein [Eubacteriales bacterium]
SSTQALSLETEHDLYIELDINRMLSRWCKCVEISGKAELIQLFSQVCLLFFANSTKACSP